MRPVLSIAGKELRGLFQSQVAVLFLAVFLVVNNLTFFVVSRFFARNLADLTPMFEWLPILLVGLVSVVAMRAWAEEQRSGTLEILLTLPVRTAHLVLGKFVAGMALVGIALATTLPLPLTVAYLGPLDPGPVLGGYLGALLLASTYLSIGLCISARTDNQVVALMGTTAVGGLLYLVGSDTVVAMLGASNGELARLIGTGSRFESIARGVVDLRDLVYYASLTSFFLVLNAYFLDRRRIDAQGLGRERLVALRALLGLVVANALLANLWLHPVRLVRLDLTENQDFTISSVTRDLLDDLDEPLLIQGVFSERSHPRLQPLVPRLATLLEEYDVLGGDSVRTELVDPSRDPSLASLLEEEFGIRPVPMPTADRNETRIVNSWFHVLLRYGDQHAVVSFQDLLEVDPSSDGADVRLRDPEYDLTMAVKRLTQEFVSTESLAEQLPMGSTLTLYASPEVLASDDAVTLQTLREVGAEIAATSERLTFAEADPLKDPGLAQRIELEYAVSPSADPNGTPYYLHLVLLTDREAQRLVPRGPTSPNALRKTLKSMLQRAVPGQLKTVGVFTEHPKAPPVKPGKPPGPPPPQDYRYLQQVLGQRFELQTTLDLSTGHVPDEVDVLVVGKVGALTGHEQLALDQFLLRGGSLIVLAGHNRVRMEKGRFAAEPTSQVFLEMLEHYGAKVDSGFVVDRQAGQLALPVDGRVVQFDYPYWLDLRGPQLDQDHLATSGITQISMPWASRVDLGAVPEGVRGDVLLHSSRDGASVPDDSPLLPDFEQWRQTGFPRPDHFARQPLAVALQGRFPSFFSPADRPPLDGALDEPVAEGRLVVLGSSEVLSDVILEYASNPMGRMHANNPLFMQNLVDWAVADTDLLSIRNPGRFSRSLDPIDESMARTLEYANYAFGGLVLATFFVLARHRRPVPVRPGRNA